MSRTLDLAGWLFVAVMAAAAVLVPYAVLGTPETSAAHMLKAARASKQLKRKRREFLLYGGALLLFVLFLYYVTRERPPASDGS